MWAWSKYFTLAPPILDLPLGTILNPPLLKFAKLASIHIVIPYQIVKFRSINIHAMVTLGPTLTPANIFSYRTSRNFGRSNYLVPLDLIGLYSF